MIRHVLPIALLVAILAGPIPGRESEAGGPFRRRDRGVVETVDRRPENQLAPSPMLGTFRPTPYVYFTNRIPNGAGYSPLGFYGNNNSMNIYGPFSSFRPVAAPVTTVVRGYDGIPAVVEGTSISTPFLPELSTVRYPNRSTNYESIRGVPPIRRTPSGNLWVDQN